MKAAPRLALGALLILGAASAAGAEPALAQGADPLAAAFIEMARNPGDPAAAVRYARLAAERGQPRAAIAALERALRIDPARDNLRLELASLHLAAGAPQLAAGYAEEVLAAPGVPPEGRERAGRILSQARRASARSTLDVELFAGLRHDSNATEATARGDFPVFLPETQSSVTVPAAVRARGDWSTLLTGRARHRQDLGLQAEAAWESNLTLFDQRFAEIPRAYDLTVLGANTGPRFGLGGGEEGTALDLRPFVTGGWIGYGGSTYAWSYGAGLGAEWRPAPRWSLELTALGRFSNYEDTAFRPRSRLYTGMEWSLAAAVSYAPGPDTRLGLTAIGYEADAREEQYARSGLGAFATASTVLTLGGYEFGGALRAGLRRVRWSAPDPLLDPFRRRTDNRWEAGASLVLPVTGRVAVVAEYEWYSQDSSYTVYRYDNHAVTVGLRLTL